MTSMAQPAAITHGITPCADEADFDWLHLVFVLCLENG